jgi:hypothetical protein
MGITSIWILGGHIHCQNAQKQVHPHKHRNTYTMREGNRLEEGIPVSTGSGPRGCTREQTQPPTSFKEPLPNAIGPIHAAPNGNQKREMKKKTRTMNTSTSTMTTGRKLSHHPSCRPQAYIGLGARSLPAAGGGGGVLCAAGPRTCPGLPLTSEYPENADRSLSSGEPASSRRLIPTGSSSR